MKRQWKVGPVMIERRTPGERKRIWKRSRKWVLLLYLLWVPFALLTWPMVVEWMGVSK